MALAVLLGCAIMALGGWYYFLRSTPEKTALKFVTAQFINGDSEAVKACMSKASLQYEQQLGEMPAGRLKEVPGLNLRLTAEPAKIKGAKATVTVRIAFPDEQAAGKTSLKSLPCPVALVKEGGEWKVDTYETARIHLKLIFGDRLDEYMLPLPPPPR